MFAVGITSQFEAAHRLRGDFGPASRVHGHTYRVEVSVMGEKLQDDGTLSDIGSLRAQVDALTGSFNYRDLDEIDGLKDRNTTAEILAEYVFHHLAEELSRKGLHTLAVRVWESPAAYGEYSGRLK
jgi:6-pyruvoyltetrahydropterin/6-carboxytetrahydropterin synthase